MLLHYGSLKLTFKANSKTQDKKTCYNCGKDNELGNYLPNPSNEKHDLIWCCDKCYEDWYIK